MTSNKKIELNNEKKNFDYRFGDHDVSVGDWDCNWIPLNLEQSCSVHQKTCVRVKKTAVL